MSAAFVLSVLGAVGVLIGILVGLAQLRSSIRDGRREQAAHDEALRRAGFEAGVASCQAQIYDLKNQVTTLTDDRNYWRGMNGGGRDKRRDVDDAR